MLFSFFTVTCLILTLSSFVSLPRRNISWYFLLVLNLTIPNLASFILSNPFLSFVILTLLLLLIILNENFLVFLRVFKIGYSEFKLGL